MWRSAWGATLLIACSFDAQGSGNTANTTSDTSGSGSTSTTGLPDSTTSAGTTSAGTTSAEHTTTTTETTQGSTGDGSTTDVVPGTWNPPQPVAMVNDGNALDDDPFLSGNQLELYFNSTRSGSADIWVATRESVDDPWDAPVRVDEVTTGAEEGTPRLSPSGLVMLFNRDDGGPGGNDIWISRRTAQFAPWSPPEEFFDLGSMGSDLAATPISGTNRIFLCSNRGATGTLDLFEGLVDVGNNSASSIDVIDELSGFGEECNPIGLDDGRVIVFHGRRRGSLGNSVDLWTATRPDLTTPFSEPVLLDDVNTDDDEFDPWISDDEQTLYFVRTTVGNGDIFSTTRVP